MTNRFNDELRTFLLHRNIIGKRLPVCIATDIDHTLYTTYSREEVISTIKPIHAKNIPTIFCTSKTRSEIEALRFDVRDESPFISENGAAVVVPMQDDFSISAIDHKYRAITYDEEQYVKVVFGTPYAILLDAIDTLRTKGFHLIGFHDMTEKQVSDDTGLTTTQARLAKRREYDEAFKLISGDENQLRREITDVGLTCCKGGKYWHITGNNDKGTAVSLVLDIYRQIYGREVLSIGLGDSENDYPMLDVVDIPILIRREGKVFPTDKYIHQENTAPQGWRIAVNQILEYVTSDNY